MNHLVCSHHFSSNLTQELTTSLHSSHKDDCRNNEIKYVRICESEVRLYGLDACVPQ